MTVDVYPISLSGRLVIPKSSHYPQGHYRSKLFTVSATPNPLIAAAGPLFSLLERLCISSSLPSIEETRQNIEHEFNAFYTQLANAYPTDELPMIAHYLLAATIDELLGKNYIRLHQKPVEFKSFTPPSHDDIGPEARFFEIVSYLKEHPNQYLDLVELAYHCLILGFEGEYHVRAEGKQLLDQLIEDLYFIIQNNRVHKPHRLYKEQPTTPQKPVSYKPRILTLIISTGLLISAWLVSHTVLEYKAKHILTQHAAVLAYME